jgi:hypothetical protein
MTVTHVYFIDYQFMNRSFFLNVTGDTERRMEEKKSNQEWKKQTAKNMHLI